MSSRSIDRFRSPSDPQHEYIVHVVSAGPRKPLSEEFPTLVIDYSGVTTMSPEQSAIDNARYKPRHNRPGLTETLFAAAMRWGLGGGYRGKNG